ncbi:MAG: hypothetical protein AAF585_01525 [Verrucomicrobiota bacterium]
MENLLRNRPEQPCGLRNEWQDIRQLLSNAPAILDPMEEMDSDPGAGRGTMIRAEGGALWQLQVWLKEHLSEALPNVIRLRH